MSGRFFQLLFISFIIFILDSCQQSTNVQDGPAVINLNDSSSNFKDSIGIADKDLRSLWSPLATKLPALKIPARIDCSTSKDSVQIELSEAQRRQLIPQEVLKQKGPVVSALYNLVLNGDTAGIFYQIYYPVVYDKLNDISCQVLLVLYNKKAQYSDYKMLSVNDYGTGYSRIKSPEEILFLYTTEKETTETDITVYDVSDKVSIRQVNDMHFSSTGNQEEYDKNNAMIEKLMK
ncbi:MAG TPA: hypothetical protein VNB90_02230 [Cytophagaceae bacterium]|nr:hypothetical protein [Cytophagaceae bacterium]